MPVGADSLLEDGLFLRAFEKLGFAKQNIYFQESPCDQVRLKSLLARPRG